MRIETITEGNNAHFRFEPKAPNMPFSIIFLDETSKTIIEATMDTDTFRNLMKEVHQMIDIDEWLNEKKLGEVDREVKREVEK